MPVGANGLYAKWGPLDEIQCKRCTRCEETRPLADFRSDGRGGRLGRCRNCRMAVRKAWLEKHREKQAAHRRRFGLSRYGLTESEYEAMWAAQSGGCAMCGQPCRTGRRLAVDHDHVTGRVRGLLCVKCNQDLGVYELIRASAEHYLAEYGAGNPHISHGEALATERSASRRGLSPGTERLADDDVRVIRARYAQGGVTQRELAREYGISQNAIGLILRRKTWTHVEDLPATDGGAFVEPDPAERLVQRMRRLTDDQIAEARQLHASGKSIRAIAAEYGVHHTTIMRLINGKHWKRATDAV